MDSNLLDINEVCNMLGVTSRTLRYYEEKGIIQSTVNQFETRRKYSPDQVEHIKHVLVLRALGLSISKIQQLHQGNIDLSLAISQHKAELIATISSKAKELTLLDEALLTVDSGGNIFEEKENNTEKRKNEWEETANAFIDAFLMGDCEICFDYFSDTLKEYLPLSAFECVVKDTLKPLGNFVKKGNFECNNSIRNAIYCDLRYENLGLYIILVFHKEKVHGIWFNYHK
ncbi:MAG: MerR family transcriptional regulator [Clostridia bacterium]|nr:MerR family transcriptional regulator [Clostridia bacterium]